MPSGPATAAAFKLGKEAWPRVRLSLERFANRTGDLEIEDQRLIERGADLFLTCACADGDPEAITYFESDVLSLVNLYLARYSLETHVMDEVRQRIRVKLLVGDPPGIAGYRGTGPLGAWVRVTAVRIALDVRGGTGAAHAWEDIKLLDLGISIDDTPELAAAKNLYRDRFKTALEEGLRALDARDKTLLRLSIVDGLNIEAIATIYRVHRATVARWFVAIRSRVLQATRAGLGLRAVPSPSEMRSLIGLLRDDIHLSAKRILAANP